MNENEITYQIRGAIFSVYNQLGPGLFESVYQEALAYEIRELGLMVETQVPLKVTYKDLSMECGFRADLLVESTVIVEIKSIESIAPVHHSQLLTYLKASGLKIGILVNFNTADLKSAIIRKVNGQLNI